MKYASRTKEPVTYVWHGTAIDGSKSIGDGMTVKQWVYTRHDGSEFVDLKRQTPVVRGVGNRAEVHRECVAAESLSVVEWANRLANK